MDYVADVSGGKDSLAMFIELVRRQYPLDEVVFYDTGMEFKAIYENMIRVKNICARKGIKFTVLKPKNPFTYDMLERIVVSKQKGLHKGYGWCGGVCRWGTAAKVKAIDFYTKDAKVHYIGIAADEPERLARLTPPKRSPLAEWGLTEADCLRICYEYGFSWNEDGVELYHILDRVSCWCCANKNRKELKNMYLYLHDYWEKLKYLQSRLDRPMKKFKSKKYGEYGNVFDMEKVFEKEEEGICRLRPKPNPNSIQEHSEVG